MDFFAQQDAARRTARILLWSFLAAVLVLILLTNAAVTAFLWFSQDYNVYGGSRGGWQGFLAMFTWQRTGTIGLAVTATVGVVVLFKWAQLSTGGKAVAEGMGGRRILPQSSDPEERRCLNVVEEMALAATMPVPALYLLEEERGINAFAAGLSPADAVVAVTRGTLEQLKRHELEGVIAHEFSHILNGDMRLNIRLAALLKGITFLSDVGYILLRSGHGARGRSGRDGGNALPVLGMALWLLGLLGGLSAGFIKAAIGRQKEFLADASAVQYTRNPDTIGDALKVIGGYVPGTLVHAARASEMSHIFFGEIRHRIWDTFASHPPLKQRIRRVDPGWDGQYIQRRRPAYGETAVSDPGVGRAAIALAAMGAATLAQAEAPVTDGGVGEGGPGLPEVLVHNSREPLGACALVCCLLFDRQDAMIRKQAAIVDASDIPGLARLAGQLRPAVARLAPPQRLPLLEMCLPALKAMSLPQYRRFKDTLLQLIHADQRVDLHEWCLYQLTRHYLDPEFLDFKPSRPRYASLQKVVYHLRTAISVLAWEGSGEAAAVFRLAADELGFESLSILPRDQCGVDAFGNAVTNLADCYPLLKPPLLKAMALAAGADGRLNAAEREIIASVAAVMDCPVPLLPEPGQPDSGGGS